MEENRENKILLNSSLLGLLFFFTFIYPFVLENIRMFESVASYNTVKIVPLPKAIRYLEILFFLILSLYVYLKHKNPNSGYVTWKEISSLFVSLTIGILIAALDSNFGKTSFFVRLQVLWILLSGYLIFYIFYNIHIDTRVTKWAVITLFGFGFLNAFVGLVQMFAWNLRDDDVNGAMQDAHTFANTMLLIIVMLVIIKKLRVFLPLLIIPFIAFVGASSQKSYIVLLSVLLIYFLFFTSLKTKVIMGVSTLFFGSLILGFILDADPTIIDRYTSFFEIGLANTGLGRAYSDIIDIHNRYIFSYLFGIGAGNYANPVNYPTILGDLSLPVSHLFDEMIEKTSARVISGAFDMQVTFVSFALIEFGAVGAYFFYRFYGRLVKKLLSIYKRTKEDLSLAVGLCLLMPLIASSFTLLYSMEQITIIYPLLGLAGIVCQREQAEPIN